MSGIGVITNPHSRRNQRNPALTQELGYILGDKGTLETPDGPDALFETAQRFYDRQIDILAVNGGDGTLHTALTSLVAVYGDTPLPKVMLLRGGTMNTVSTGLGVYGTPASLLDYVVTRYHQSIPYETTKRATMRVDNDKFGFIFGNGVVAQYLELYYEGGTPSPQKAVTTLGRAILSGFIQGPYFKRMTRSWSGQVVIDNETWTQREWLAIAAGTVDNIGVGFRSFYRGPDQTDAFHALGLDMTGFEFIKELPRIYRAQPMKCQTVRDKVGKHMVLQSEEPIPYMIDGDFHRGGTEVVVEVGPTVEFIIPER